MTTKPPAPDPADVPEVESLKAAVRRLRRLAIAGPFLAAVVGMLPAFLLPRLEAIPDDVARYGPGATLAARKMVLVDESGRVRGELKFGDRGSAALDLFHEDGSPGVNLAVGPNGIPWLTLAGPGASPGASLIGGGSPELSMRDAAASERINLSVFRDSAWLAFKGSKLDPKIQMGVKGGGLPFLDLYEQTTRTAHHVFEENGDLMIQVTPPQRPQQGIAVPSRKARPR